MAQLWAEFAVSSALAVLCVVTHGLGLFSLSHALRSETAVERLKRIAPLSPRGVAFTLGIVVAILALHGIEIWLFAFVYLAIGATAGLEDALYFSTISYSTVGYSDVHILSEWRLLGAFESILGMVLIGWSTAFFFRMLGRMEAH
ncbi:MAG: potassium channel family protein [Alphaproteobacteria bacterium]|jgi:predicted exporter